MPSGARRPSESLLQLYQAEEGMLLLSRRPAASNGPTTSDRVKGWIGRAVSVVLLFACSCRWSSIGSVRSISPFAPFCSGLSAISSSSKHNHIISIKKDYHPDRSHWESPFYDHGPTSAGHSTPDDSSHSYWRLGDSPMTSAFSSQFSGPPSSLSHHAYEPRSSFAAFRSPREDHGWPVAPRSMSFGQVEDLSHSYTHPYQSSLSMDYRRRPAELYPPSLQTSSGNSSKHNSNGEVSTPPLPAAVTSQPMAQFVSPAWNALPGHSMISKAPEYSTWYSEPAPLAKVQEEEIGPSFHGGPEAIFTSVG
ncbi:MAG: hypothetical protein Q9228_006185 [Teloschistes exilis]